MRVGEATHPGPKKSFLKGRTPTVFPEVISAPVSVPGLPARLRLLKRMSEATTEVAPSRGDSAVPQEVARRQGTWVEMTVEDSDDEDEEWDPDIRVFDPVESDDDSVLDALQRDLEGVVGPRSQFENDVSPSFHSAQRGSNMWGNSCPGRVGPFHSLGHS